MHTMSRPTSRRTHRTVQGRIVYDRPKHYFTYSRAIRILGKVDWSKETPEDLNASVRELQTIYIQLLSRGLQRAGIDGNDLMSIGQFAIDILYQVRGKILESLNWVWEALKNAIKLLLGG